MNDSDNQLMMKLEKFQNDPSVFSVQERIRLRELDEKLDLPLVAGLFYDIYSIEEQYQAFRRLRMMLPREMIPERLYNRSLRCYTTSSIERNDMELFVLLVPETDVMIPLYNITVKANRPEMLRHLFAIQRPFDNVMAKNAGDVAIEMGHTECLQILKENHYPPASTIKGPGSSCRYLSKHELYQG